MGDSPEGIITMEEWKPGRHESGSVADDFAARVVLRFSTENIEADVDIRPVSSAVASEGDYLVDIRIKDGPDILCEVADWVPGVRVMDPNAEDMTTDQALEYVALRAKGVPARDALGSV